MLVHLMCAQARECLFEKAELGVAAAADCSSPEVVEECLSVGQEASHVSDVYGKVHAIMADEGQEDYVPFSWVALAQVKKEHYRYKTLLQNPLEIRPLFYFCNCIFLIIILRGGWGKLFAF